MENICRLIKSTKLKDLPSSFVRADVDENLLCLYVLYSVNAKIEFAHVIDTKCEKCGSLEYLCCGNRKYGCYGCKGLSTGCDDCNINYKSFTRTRVLEKTSNRLHEFKMNFIPVIACEWREEDLLVQIEKYLLDVKCEPNCVNTITEPLYYYVLKNI
jgi:hypothetical protein